MGMAEFVFFDGRVCVCACVRACMRACVRACGCVCVLLWSKSSVGCSTSDVSDAYHFCEA